MAAKPVGRTPYLSSASAQAAALRAAGAGVGQLAPALAGDSGRRLRPLDVLARAGAGVGQVGRDEAVERGLVRRAARGLPDGWRVGVQAAARQLLQDQGVGAGAEPQAR